TGGKVEPGESGEAAVVRELREELGIDAEVVQRVPGEWPLRPPYALRVWTARLRPGSPAPAPLQDHDALRWLTPAEVWDVDWLDQVVPAVRDALAHIRRSPPRTRGGLPRARRSGGPVPEAAFRGHGRAAARTPDGTPGAPADSPPGAATDGTTATPGRRHRQPSAPPPRTRPPADGMRLLNGVCATYLTKSGEIGRDCREVSRVIDIEGDCAAWTFPAEPGAVRGPRAAVRTQLHGWGLDGVGDLTALLVSELVTNALRHATGPIGVRLVRPRGLTGVLRVEVSDTLPDPPHECVPRPEDEHGRGLQLVASTS